MTVSYPQRNGNGRLQTKDPYLSPEEERLTKEVELPWCIGSWISGGGGRMRCACSIRTGERRTMAVEEAKREVGTNGENVK